MTKHGPVPDEALETIVTILDLVRNGSAASRSEIIQMTGLSKAVVMQRVNDLVARGFIRESASRSTGGRPPRRLAFRAEVGHLLVADVGATSIDVAVANVGGEIVAHRAEGADLSQGPEAIIERLESLFGQILAECVPAGDLWGLGFGLPGPVEFNTGKPISPAAMPGWDGFPLREHFMKRYAAPVWVDNDVNIMTLGEWRSGVASGHDNVIFVKVGTGIGSGIISDGAIHRGAQGSAGDIGHTPAVDDTSEVCRCGNIGCLESLAGGGALARDAGVLALAGKSPQLSRLLDARGQISASDVSRAASMGDPVSVELLDRSGRLVGSAVAGLVNFFNPSLIVIGGGVANAGDAYLATIRRTIYARGTPLATRDLSVQLSRLGSRVGVIGASSMVLDQLFSAEYLRRWIGRGQPTGMSIPAA